ncbi:MAG: Methylamine utilization protein mauG precursor [Nevskia sp.]|nr:Methylamine utilization protein mauG precursor [Nevskia sp.]
MVNPAVVQAAAARLDAPPRPLSPMAQLGRKLFFDPGLSASGRMACAFCHNPDHAYAPGNALPAQFGGPGMNLQGSRATPSLTYLERTPRFIIRPPVRFDPDEGGTPKAARPAVPEGGMDWDGRAASLPDQASGPLFDPREMANRDGTVVLARLKATPYANEFTAVFGAGALDSQEAALSSVYQALARFQIEDRSFHTYDSKFDYYLAGRAQLSARELRGLKLFNDPQKGNCAACHPDRPTKNRLAPVFTDYEFEALAAPRNRALAADGDPAYFDEGLCGPARKDLIERPEYCGLFKTPTLRNVAKRQVFFHNGVFRSLQDVVRFYVERETRPEKWYSLHGDGTVMMYDDLPPGHRAGIDGSDAPFNRRRGEAPALDEQEIQDLVAFLETLTDGYSRNQTITAAAGNPGK